ncbi:hypothetical protein GF385_04755, partial [Candidatus Dependentiae bacterium]|nr:hypothetical protein [Candidatus Dependentiae bacterium]
SNAENFIKSTPLHFAAEKGHQEIVKILLARGADFSAKDKFKNTPLYYAAKKGHQDIVKMLLDKDANPSSDAENYFKYTPLHAAAEKGNKEVVEILLVKKGVDLSASDRYGNTPLHLAAENGHQDIVKMLLDKGADSSAKNENKYTPLHLAAKKGHLEIVKILVKAGADPSAKDENGYIPLDLAENPKIRNILIKAREEIIKKLKPEIDKQVKRREKINKLKEIEEKILVDKNNFTEFFLFQLCKSKKFKFNKDMSEEQKINRISELLDKNVPLKTYSLKDLGFENKKDILKISTITHPDKIKGSVFQTIATQAQKKVNSLKKKRRQIKNFEKEKIDMKDLVAEFIKQASRFKKIKDKLRREKK